MRSADVEPLAWSRKGEVGEPPRRRAMTWPPGSPTSDLPITGWVILTTVLWAAVSM